MFGTFEVKMENLDDYNVTDCPDSLAETELI